MSTVDVSMFKDTKITERVNLHFRAECWERSSNFL